MSNIFSINNEEMDNTIIGYNKICTDTDSTLDSIPSKFQSITKTGLFSSGLSTITKQLSKVSSSVSNLKKIIRKQSDKTYEMELSLAKEADQIEIPQNFVKNDAKRYSTIEDIVLNKNDGKSINEGQETEKTNEIRDNNIVKENLTNIVKEDTEIINEEFNSNVENTKMKNINNGNETEQHKIKDDYSSNKEQLNDIKNNSSFEVNQSLNTNGINVFELKNINSNISEGKTEYHDKYNTNEVRFENVNKESKELHQVTEHQENKHTGSNLLSEEVLESIINEYRKKVTSRDEEI